MQHSPEELALLKAAVIANPTAAAARTDGNVEGLLAWLNAPTATMAWRSVVSYQQMVLNIKFATFDSVSAGKQKAFEIMLEAAKNGVLDAEINNKVRNGIADIFAVTGGYTDATQAQAMLEGACIEPATNAQLALGYATPPAVANVTAINRVFTGQCAEDTANWLINN